MKELVIINAGPKFDAGAPLILLFIVPSLGATTPEAELAMLSPR